MATQAYRDWVKAGRPWKKATPIDELETLARRHGVQVLGTIGNEAHLTADKPEDHTPFSQDGWPTRPVPDHYVTAIDLSNVHNLGSRLLSDARGGRIPWVKYLNFNGQHYDVREGWQPRHSDDQHVHISIRSDWCTRSIGNYDPFTGGSQPGAYEVVAWQHANVRDAPSSSGKIVSYVEAGNSYPASCWIRGQTVNAEGRTNDIWIMLPLRAGGFGYVSAIYLKGDKYADLPSGASC